VTSRLAHGAAAGVLLAAVVAGCGKKGNPLPPLRPVPARIADFTATRTAGEVELRFTVPAANLDGSTPVAIDRVDIYAVRAAAGQTPSAAGQIAADQRNLIESLPVRRPLPGDRPGPDTSVSVLVPAPGDMATHIDRTAEAEHAGVTAIFYVAVPVVGTGRGRSGPPTPVANVPLGPLPAAPGDVAVSHDEATLRLSWTPAAEGHAFRVFRALVDGDGRPAVRPMTPDPVTTSEVTAPVEFGQQVCFVVQAVEVAGAVSVAGAPTDRVCTTPVDRYPPPVPAGLRVVQEGAAVTVLWDGVDAPDLAGYIVLRGAGAAVDMVPLMREPLKATVYRDTTAVAGATYSYAVYSVDAAPAANASAMSARETITLR